jgi:hypothetical protein
VYYEPYSSFSLITTFSTLTIFLTRSMEMAEDAV